MEQLLLYVFDIVKIQKYRRRI